MRVGDFALERSLEWLVNDGLMVIFFFVVGLEIRREIHHGELSELRRAALPLAAALGGMVVPALLYLALAGSAATRSGWGVPMATDIAFAVGILTLLGKRVPPALRVLLLALAVIDDLGAIVVIALFYSAGISSEGLALAAAGLAAIFVLTRFGVRAKAAYLVPGVVVWAGIAMSGIHPTIAGVIIGLITPVQAWLGPTGFLVGMKKEMDELERASPEALSLARAGEDASARRHRPPRGDVAGREPDRAAPPLGRLRHHAALRARQRRGRHRRGHASTPRRGTCWLEPRSAWWWASRSACSSRARWRFASGRHAARGAGRRRHLVVLGAVAGVGFTMALFIAQLAFADAALLGAAKLGVLIASGVASVIALLLGRALLRPAVVPEAAQTADEAESSTAQ